MPLPLPTDSVWQLDSPVLAAPANPNNTSAWGVGTSNVYPGNDPDFAQVGYLVPFNDPINTIAVADIVTSNTWAGNGNASQISVQSFPGLFGQNNLRAAGAADYQLTCSKPADFIDTPNGIVTLEGWFRYNDVAGVIHQTSVGFLGRAGSGSNNTFIQVNHEVSPGRVYVSFQLAGGDFGGVAVSTTFYVNNSASSYVPFTLNWQYIAATYDGITARLYLNGVLVAAQPAAPRRIRYDRYRIGNIGSPSVAFTSFFANCRFTNGVARYTGATCPVPAGPFPDFGPNGP